MSSRRMHSDWVRSLAFSPDGQWLLTGSDDETIQLHDAQTLDTVFQTRAHDWSVASVA